MNKRYCKYSQCKDEFIPVKGRFNQQTCDKIECARGYASEKLAKKEAKDQNELILAFRANIKGLSEYKADLEEPINKIVRLIDKGHPCISSDRQNYTVHAGHFLSVGAHDNLRFHLLNIYAQSDSDNTYGGANITGYRKGIVKYFGQEIMDLIDGLEAKYPVLKLSKTDCIEAKHIANKIVKELEEENKVYTNKERIELRIRFNERLQIYK